MINPVISCTYCTIHAKVFMLIWTKVTTVITINWVQTLTFHRTAQDNALLKIFFLWILERKAIKWISCCCLVILKMSPAIGLFPNTRLLTDRIDVLQMCRIDTNLSISNSSTSPAFWMSAFTSSWFMLSTETPFTCSSSTSHSQLR